MRLAIGGAAVLAALIIVVVGLVSASPAPADPPPAQPLPVNPIPVVPVSPASAPAALDVQRQGPADDAESVSLRDLERALAAPGAHIENPCVQQEQAGCARTALDPFFTALDTLPSRNAPVTVVALGNSLIAGDGVVDIVRTRLTTRFGSAGRGFLLADRMAKYGGRTRTAAAANGWTASTFAPPLKYLWPFGLAGVHHTAERAKAFSRFNLEGETRAEIFWLDRPEASAVDVLVDGTKALTLTPTGTAGGHRTPLTLPENAKTLELVAQAKGAVIQGVTLEKEQPGVILDMLGVPSSDASLFVSTDPDLFKDQLAARRASLVLLMFGGNETKRIGWGRSTAETVERDLKALIGRVHAATPAACWVIGPLDAVKPKGPRPFTQRPELEEVIAIERRVALAEGCAFFDLFAAMGGSGSIKRLQARGLMHPDKVHPKGKGLDMLGQLISDALFEAYAAAPPVAPLAEVQR